MALVHPSKYKPYVLNPDINYVPVLQERFRAVGIPCEADPKFDCTLANFLIKRDKAANTVQGFTTRTSS